tara:strand:+ start:14966 stop:15652 length:687 start_codon:yes stop_codon:yes gene_type:complete
MSKSNEFGIVIRGKIMNWTKDIVNEYQNNFPDTQIVVSTWTNENTSDINCDVIKTDEISMPSPHRSSINHQVTLAKNGLKKISSEIIMVCRSDQFIHNKNIFEIFKNKCPEKKILVSSFPAFVQGTPQDYRYTYSINDMCQIGKSNLIHNFWDHVPEFDGSKSISVARTIVKNYVVTINKDDRDWAAAKNDYFYERDYYRDLKIEWQRPIEFTSYRQTQNKTIKKFSK